MTYVFAKSLFKSNFLHVKIYPLEEFYSLGKVIKKNGKVFDTEKSYIFVNNQLSLSKQDYQ